MVDHIGTNEPGSDDSSRRDEATDSRPISVSELLARSQAAGGADDAPARRRDGHGRRRAGRTGAVSVSELTGEIPRVDGPSGPDTAGRDTAGRDTAGHGFGPDDSADRGTASDDTADRDTASHDTTAPAPQTERWAPEPASGPFPRSQNPIAPRGADRAPIADTAPRTAAPLSRTASGMPGFTPPPTRDFTAGDVSRRLSEQSGPDTTQPESSDAVTGIIPLVDDGPDDSDAQVSAPTASEPAPTTAIPSGSNRSGKAVDDDFAAYRSFADVEHEGDEPKKKRRWFGRGKKAAAGAAAAGAVAAGATKARGARTADDDARGEFTATTGATGARTAPAATEVDQPDDVAADAITGIIPIVDYDEVGDDVHVLDPDDVEGADLAAPSGSFRSTGTDEPADTVAANVLDPADDLDTYANTHGPRYGYDEPAETVAAPMLDDDDLDDDALGADSRYDEDSRYDGDAGQSGAAGTAAIAETAKTKRDKRSGPDKKTQAEAAKPAKGKPSKAKKSEDEPATDKPAKDKGRGSWADRSPVLAWAAVILEVLAGLAIGVGLFWGFTELWKWNPYFALVLAVLVVFGIVTFTHLVRRTSDLITTLLALAVGLIVTIGPLVLLST
ncbi:DoxX family protein [Gordonia sp. DT30]|uniref:DoxX family protein n=1 Tax=Gordonia sp. DT30 TaxID=3416546 RepID=UPI003CF82C44